MLSRREVKRAARTAIFSEKPRRELKCACAACAVVAGAAFSSGREVASFFACAGWASWIGIPLSSAIFGALMGMLCHFAQTTRARTLGGIYLAKLDARCADTISVIHLLLMLMMGAVALSTASELGLLMLAGDSAHILAAGIAMLAAILLALRGMRPFMLLGAVIVPATLVFFFALALDTRAPATGVYIKSPALDMRGNAPIAILLAALFAFLKSAMAGGVAVAQARGLRPKIYAAWCALILCALLSAINVSLQRFGRELWSLNLPVVVLAARWGVPGYYICIAIMYLCCVSVLTGALGTLIGQFSASFNRPAALMLTGAAIAMISVTGLRSLVSVGYPMLGYMSAISLGALALFWDRRDKSRRAPQTP